MKAYKKLAALAVCASALLGATTARAVSDLVIAEVYGGGGNSGAYWLSDFVVVFNRGNTPIDVNGYSIQYNSAGGTGTWQVTPLANTSKIIPAGGYFLVKEADGGNTSGTAVALPTPDAIGTIPMGATGCKIALVNNITPLVGQFATGTGAGIIDFVGCGAANGFEGSNHAGTPANGSSVVRLNSGCTDTDDNAADFVVSTGTPPSGGPTPRNSATPLHSCGPTGLPPIISGVTPASATTNVGGTVNFSVALSQGDAPVYLWFKIAGGVTNLIPSATTATLTLANVQKAVDEASYQAVVTNTIGADTSSIVSLTIVDPAILVQPANTFGLLDGAASFSVTAAATSPTYQWYFVDGGSTITASVSDGPQANGSYVIGSTASLLTITNLQLSSPTNYAVVVSDAFGSVTSSVASLTGVSVTGILAWWDFNGPEFLANPPASIQTPAPYIGVGTAFAVGSANVPGTGGTSSPFNNTVVDPNDGPFANPFNHLPNQSWGTATYPAQGTANKTAGVQFNVSTVGAKDITVSYDGRVSATSSKYARLQFTTNGTDWVDYPTSSIYPPAQVSHYVSFAYNLTGFPGVRNNPNFGFRVVSEFESTATYGLSANANYAGDNNAYGTGGTVTFDAVNISGTAITNNNTPPTITSIPDTNTVENAPLTVDLTVGDAESAPNQLVVTGQSLDPSLGASFSYDVVNHKLTITPFPLNTTVAVAPILVTVTDPAGDSTATWFDLTVTSISLPPTNTLTALPFTNVLANSSVTIPFTVGDDHTALGDIIYSASSDNQTVVPDANIVISGTAPNKTVTITPAPNQTGVATISVNVNDNDPTFPKTTTARVSLLVLPNTNVVFVDNFNYDASGSLDSVSSNFWKHLSGGFGQMKVGDGVVTVDTLDYTENLQVGLLGAPYATNSPAELYFSMIVNLNDPLRLPQANGTYIAAFNDGSGATANILCKFMVATNGAADGFYRLGIANVAATAATGAQMFPQDLAYGSSYVAVARLVVSNGFATLWVSPYDKSSPSVTDTDAPDTLFNISDFELRESGANAGSVSVSKLKVGTTFDSVFPVPHIETIGGQSIVTWSDPTITLQSATIVTGPYTDVIGATSPYTNNTAAPVQFFRFKP